MPPETTINAGRYDLLLREGGTYRRTFVWSIDGDPVDLTGCGVTATLRTSTTAAGDPLLELTDGDGLTLDGSAGEIALLITDEQAATDLRGAWDLKIEWPGGDETYLLAGRVTWRKAVTR